MSVSPLIEPQAFSRAIARNKKLVERGRAMAVSVYDFVAPLPNSMWGKYELLLDAVSLALAGKHHGSIAFLGFLEMEAPVEYLKRRSLGIVDAVCCCTLNSNPELLLHLSEDSTAWRTEIVHSRSIPCAMAESRGLMVEWCAGPRGEFLAVSAANTKRKAARNQKSTSDASPFIGRNFWFLEQILRSYAYPESEWTIRLPRVPLQRILISQYPNREFDENLCCLEGSRRLSVRARAELERTRDFAVRVHEDSMDPNGITWAATKAMDQNSPEIDWGCILGCKHPEWDHEHFDAIFGSHIRTALTLSDAIIRFVTNSQHQEIPVEKGKGLILIVEVDKKPCAEQNKCVTPYLECSTPPTLYWVADEIWSKAEKTVITLQARDNTLHTLTAHKMPGHEWDDEVPQQSLWIPIRGRAG